MNTMVFLTPTPPTLADADASFQIIKGAEATTLQTTAATPTLPLVTL